MSPSAALSALVLFLHDLFTVLWIGGILFMAMVLMPALRAARAGTGAPSEAREGPLALLAKKVQSRLAVVSIASLVGLVVTGVLLARQRGVVGLLRFDTAYAAVLSIKHLLVVALAGTSLVRRRVLGSGGRAAAALLATSAALAVAVLALSALNAAMP
jgi:putative copper resistance protein D